MAKKKKFKDRIAEAKEAAAKKATEKVVEKAPEPAPMPTVPVSQKVKRPRYVRPPREANPVKIKTEQSEPAEPRMVRFSSRTLTLAAEKMLAKADKKPPAEEKFGR